MEDLKNDYLNEQGLRQERDALRVENERLRAVIQTAYEDALKNLRQGESLSRIWEM